MPSECAPPCSQRRAFLTGFVTFIAWESLPGSRAQAGELRVGAPAPAATLVTLDGEKISTVDLTGQVVILSFWATWCAPCREELPMLSEYFVQHAQAGLRVLGFSLDEREKLPEVRQIAQSLRFPVGLMADSSAPSYGRIWRLPVNFTIDRAGRLVGNGWKEKPPGWTRQRLNEVVTPLLAPPDRSGVS